MAFRFFAPQQPDISGVIAGAQGILQGGQAQGAGLAAEGQAMGQAYASIGQSIAEGVAMRAEKEEEKVRDEALNKYLDGLDDDSNFENRSFMDIDSIDDPNVRAIYDRSQAGDSSGDPDANRAQLFSELVQYYEGSRGLTRAEAVNNAQGLLTVKQERVLTPEARAQQKRGAAVLIAEHGVPPAAVSLLIDSRGVSGYADDQSLQEDRTKRVNDRYGYQTPAAKLKVKLAEEQAIAEQKRFRQLQQEQEVEDLIQQTISEPVVADVPTAFGVKVPVPVGAQRRGFTPVSIQGETGVAEQFAQRAAQAGLPTEALMADLNQQEGVSFVGQQALKDVRRLLREKGLSASAVNDELLQRKLFSDRNDPAFREYVDDRVAEIERRHLASEAPVDNSGGFNNSQKLYIRSMEAGLAQALKAGGRTEAVALGSLENVDMPAVELALKDVFGQQTDMAGKFAKLQVGLNEEGNVVVKGGMSDSELQDLRGTPEVMKVLDRVLGMQDLRREVAYAQSAGAFEGRSKTEINTFMEHLRINRPEVFQQLMQDGAGGVVPADTIPAPQRADLTPGEAALLGDPTQTLTSGASVGSGESPPKPPDAGDLEAAARRRQNLPPAADPTSAAEADRPDLTPRATAAVDALNKQAIVDSLNGDDGAAKRRGTLAMKLEKAVSDRKWGEVERLLKLAVDPKATTEVKQHGEPGEGGSIGEMTVKTLTLKDHIARDRKNRMSNQELEAIYQEFGQAGVDAIIKARKRR